MADVDLHNWSPIIDLSLISVSRYGECLTFALLGISNVDKFIDTGGGIFICLTLFLRNVLREVAIVCSVNVASELFECSTILFGSIFDGRFPTVLDGRAVDRFLSGAVCGRSMSCWGQRENADEGRGDASSGKIVAVRHFNSFL